MNDSTSIYEYSVKPYQQALVVFGCVVLLEVGIKLTALSGIVPISARLYWMIAASFMLLFAVGNSLLSLSAKNMASYWGQSIYSFMGLALGNGLVAWGFSSLTISEAGSYRWIYVVVTIGYLVFLSLIGVVRIIVEFAQREEWNQPRKKNR